MAPVAREGKAEESETERRPFIDDRVWFGTAALAGTAHEPTSVRKWEWVALPRLLPRAER